MTFGETRNLLLHHITAQGKPLKDHVEIVGHNEAILLIEHIIKENRPLTEQFIKELHQMLLVKSYEVDAITPDGNHTKKRIQVGQYKSSNNHVKTKTGEMFYFTDHNLVTTEMGVLLEWYKVELEKGRSVLLKAPEFHYRFIRIHPFDDGNGRKARILMNFILMTGGYPPVVIKSEKKEKYYAALQQADGGDLQFFFVYILMGLEKSLEIMLRGARGEDITDLDDFDKELSLLKANLDTIPNQEISQKNS